MAVAAELVGATTQSSESSLIAPNFSVYRDQLFTFAREQLPDTPEEELNFVFGSTAEHLSENSEILQSWEKGGLFQGDFSRIVWHCMYAAAYGRILAEQIGLTSEQTGKITTALLLHDWFKRAENGLLDAYIDNGLESQFTPERADAMKRLDHSMLQELGCSDEIIALSGANMPHDTYGPNDPVSATVWLSDAMLSNIQPIPFKERMDRSSTGNGGTFIRSALRNNLRYSAFYRKHGEHHDVVQNRIGERLDPEFIERIQGHAYFHWEEMDEIDREDVSTLIKAEQFEGLPVFLKSKLNQRVQQDSQEKQLQAA